MSTELRRTIAVDFDGTLFENAWPNIGNPIRSVIEAVKSEKAKGSGIILWTCREGKLLEAAIAACAEQGIIFDAVNDSTQEWHDFFGNNVRKVGADEYWDDKAVSLHEICFRQEVLSKMDSCNQTINKSKVKE